MGVLGRLALGGAAALILWTYSTFDQHPLLERPLLSEALVLLFAAILSLAASCVAKWWTGRNGRFHDDEAKYRSLEESRRPGHPAVKRPQRGSSLLLIGCILGRLHLLRWQQLHLECSSAGIEALLPMVLAVYEWHIMSKSPESASNDDEEDDDIANDFFEDFAAWFPKSQFIQLLGTSLISIGAYIALQPSNSSNVVCTSSHSRVLILGSQCLGVLLDAVILTVAYNLLQWIRTARNRFTQTGVVLGASSLGITVTALVPTLLFWSGSIQFAETSDIDSLYIFHIIGHSSVCLFIATSFFARGLSPLSSTGIVVFICGTRAAVAKLALLGTFEQLSYSQVILSTNALGLGFMVFVYRNHIGHIGIPSILLILVALAWIIGIIPYTALLDDVFHRHPLEEIVYRMRTVGDRWIVQDAKVSESLSVAVREYIERHNGRKPPPKFDTWYDYAISRDSPIIDNFRQIENDLRPFWNAKPARIVEEISRLRSSHGIGTLSIKQGIVTSQPPQGSYDEAVMADLAELILPFAQHLPDMELPINLLDQPRVLLPHSDATNRQYDKSHDTDFQPSWEYQRQLGQSCPDHSPSRSGFHVLDRDFCWSCVRPHSEEQFPNNIELVRDICHQPDIFNLHGFYMSHQPQRPMSELVPVFSSAKTDQFSDILIPLNRHGDDFEAPKGDKVFTDKANRIFWRGEMDAGPLRAPHILAGGHQERLSHLINNASAHDRVTMLLPKRKETGTFKYESVLLREVNAVLNFNMGIGDYLACSGAECDRARREFGLKPQDDGTKKLESRYVMVMDTDQGPPRDFLKVLRSSSVPVVASMFKEWYTERLFPWLHYVPIDIRFHGLHSTMAYFQGLENQGVVNGRDVPLAPRTEDARWISEQGQRWAKKAIRREDAEIYMFRLLLEWGRVIDEKRDELGFELKKP